MTIKSVDPIAKTVEQNPSLLPTMSECLTKCRKEAKDKHTLTNLSERNNSNFSTAHKMSKIPVDERENFTSKFLLQGLKTGTLKQFLYCAVDSETKSFLCSLRVHPKDLFTKKGLNWIEYTTYGGEVQGDQGWVDEMQQAEIIAAMDKGML